MKARKLNKLYAIEIQQRGTGEFAVEYHDDIHMKREDAIAHAKLIRKGAGNMIRVRVTTFTANRFR